MRVDCLYLEEVLIIKKHAQGILKKYSFSVMQIK